MAEIKDSFQSLLHEACLGNEAALSFLMLFNRYSHAIDDIIDESAAGRRVEPEFILNAFAMGCTVYGHPFYLANIVKLQQTAYLVASAYSDSVKWEQSAKLSHRSCADVLRFAGNEMLFAVALICGGYEHLRRISSVIRERSWNDHHDEAGNPI